MTDMRQDFTTYAGDAGLPLFTVTDGTGAPIDISTVSNITWAAQRDLSSTAVLSKSLQGATITLVGGGTTGQFQVQILSADTAGMSGFYIHKATIFDASGNPSTVATGRMRVGPPPVWTYSGDPTTSTKDQVRALIGDTDWDDPLLTDGEINWFVTQRSTVYGAAAFACRSLATKYARQVDNVVGEMHLLYSQRTKSFNLMAQQFEGQAAQRGGGAPYAGGVSVAQKIANFTNPDIVQPQFNIGMDDNYIIPLSPAGNETPYGSSGGVDAAEGDV